MKSILKLKPSVSVLLIGIAFALLTSCTQNAAAPIVEVSPSAKPVVDNSARITLTNDVDLTDMNLFWQYDWAVHSSPDIPLSNDDNAKISIYTDAYKTPDGEFLYDDGHDWMLLMETSSGYYPLFPRKYVQLGSISCSVFLDNTLHVLVTEQWGSSYQIYDCIFDSDRNAFTVKPIYESGNISFISDSRWNY